MALDDHSQGVAPPSTNTTAPATTAPTTNPAATTKATATSKPTAAAVAKTIPTSRGQTTPVNFDDIDQRLSLLPIGVDVGEVAISPDGKMLACEGVSGGRANIYLYPVDPLAQHPSPRQLTSSGGGKSFLQFASDSGAPGSYRLYYLEDRSVHWISVAPGGLPQDVPVNVEFDMDFNRDKMLAFDQAWRYLNENFHDPAMHGVEWKAVRERFAPYIAGARTATELRRLLTLMIGELNSSHMTASSSGAEIKQSVARLGLSFDPREYQQTGRLRISAVLPLGPAALSGITAGKYLLDVDGTSTARPANLDQLLDHKLDKEVTLTLADDASGGNKKETKVTTISGATERTLGYRQWVRDNRDYLKKISNGRGQLYSAMAGTGVGNKSLTFTEKPGSRVSPVNTCPSSNCTIGCPGR